MKKEEMTNIEKKERLINAFSDPKFQLDLKSYLVVIKKFLMESVEKIAIEIKETETFDTKPFLYLKEPESRIKKIDSFKEKIERKSYFSKWNISESKENNIKAIKNGLGDLIGFRFLCYFYDHEEILYLKFKDYLEKNNFDHYRWDFSQDKTQRNGHPIYKFQGFYFDIPFEVQIKSLANSLWGEVEHSESYKSTTYSIYDDSKKELFDNLFEILGSVDSELVGIYKLRYKEDKLVRSLFYLKCSEMLKKEYGFFPNAKIFSRFDTLLNSDAYPKARKDVEIFVGKYLTEKKLCSCDKPSFSENKHRDTIYCVLNEFRGHIYDVLASIFNLLYGDNPGLFDEFLISYVENNAFKIDDECLNDSFKEDDENEFDQVELIRKILSGLFKEKEL